jgi:hypothetical protein
MIPSLLTRDQFAEVRVVFQVNIQDQACNTVADLTARGLSKDYQDIHIGFLV